MRLEPCDSQVVTVTSSAVISNRNCILQGLLLTPAAASCTVALYDPPTNTTTTTNATLKIVLAAAAAGNSASADLTGSGIQFLNGCIAVVVGTGAQATVVTAKI
jgi:hypothetical protein